MRTTSLGGTPVAVTYCPLCNASVVFERSVENRVLDFGTTGKLRNSDLVMYDRQTESWGRRLRMAYLPSMPKDASLLDVFRMFPETNEPLIAFHESLLRGPSPFTEGERELVAAYVSGLNGCRYCHVVHTATAERLGIES